MQMYNVKTVRYTHENLYTLWCVKKSELWTNTNIIFFKLTKDHRKLLYLRNKKQKNSNTNVTFILVSIAFWPEYFIIESTWIRSENSKYLFSYQLENFIFAHRTLLIVNTSILIFIGNHCRAVHNYWLD